MKAGLQDYQVEQTDDEWVLYHNNFSLCSRKVRMCLAEYQIAYRSEHIDLIETGKYEVASKRFLKINPGATVPVLLHKGRPIYESHEQIYYLAKQNEAKENASSSSKDLIPIESNDLERMNYWVDKSSLVGDPLENHDVYAGNAVAPLTFPLFATMIQYIPTTTIVKGLWSHPVKIRVFVFLILKLFGLSVFKSPSPIIKIVKKAHSSLNIHLQELDDHLSASESEWILGDQFSLADVSWAVLFHRIEETGWIGLLIEDKPSLRSYFQRIKERASYKEAVVGFEHPIVSKGVSDLGKAINGDTGLNRVHAALRAENE